MNVKSVITLIGTVILVLLCTPHHSAIAAPTGELTIAYSTFGNEVPLPWQERGDSNDYMKLLYDPLVATTPEAALSKGAGMAENWEMSPDGLTWTFYLRKGVKFHDGVEVTTKDVKFSIEKMMEPNSKAYNANPLRAILKGVEIKDNYTLILHCKTPFIYMPDGLLSDIPGPFGSILPKDYYERIGQDKFAKNPIGSGPYKWHSQVTGSFVKLEATEKHWRDGVPRFKYVTFRIIPEESTQIAMLKTGEADLARISREGTKEILDAGLNIVYKKNSSMVVFQPNMQWETHPLKEVNFRKALNLALDKEAIIRHILGGKGRPTTTYPGANISGVRGVPILKPYPYAPEEARRLIKGGGFEGAEIVVPVYHRGGFPELPLVVEAACGYWEKIGVKPRVLNIEWARYFEMRNAQKTKGHVQITNSTTCSALSELVRLFRDNLYSTMPRPLIKEAKIDEIIDRCERSIDRAQVEKILIDLYRYMYDNYTFIPICDIDDPIATAKNIPKWDPGSRGFDRNINDLIRQR